MHHGQSTFTLGIMPSTVPKSRTGECHQFTELARVAAARKNPETGFGEIDRSLPRSRLRAGNHSGLRVLRHVGIVRDMALHCATREERSSPNAVSRNIQNVNDKAPRCRQCCSWTQSRAERSCQAVGRESRYFRDTMSDCAWVAGQTQPRCRSGT